MRVPLSPHHCYRRESSSGYDLPGVSELTQQAERRDAQCNHPMAGCCNLIPFVDTPSSPLPMKMKADLWLLPQMTRQALATDLRRCPSEHKPRLY